MSLLIAGKLNQVTFKGPFQPKLFYDSVIVLGGGYFCCPFDVHWEGVSTAMAELRAAASLLHRHPQPRHSELMGCQ